MMKLAIFAVLFVAAAAKGVADVSSQRALIHHITPKGYGNGVSSRYFDKVENRGIGLGLYGGLAYGGPYYGGAYYGGRYLGGDYYGGRYLGGMAYDGVDNLGLAYTGRFLADGYLGRGYGYGRYGLGYGRLGYGYGRLGYGYA